MSLTGVSLDGVPSDGGADLVRRLVVFTLDGQRYGVDLAATERALPMIAASPLPGAPAIVLGALNLHGEVIPMLDLRRRLGLAAVDHAPDQRLLVARAAGRTVALPVDEVLGVAEIPPESVVAPDAVAAGGAEHLEGVAVLPDGLLLIEDLDVFLSAGEEQELSALLGGPAE